MILVTGASGFIGRHLYNALREKYGNENVVALTSIPPKEGLFLLHNQYQFSNNFFNKVEGYKIDTVIHAGAFTPKNSSEANLIEQCNINIYNTQQLINNLPLSVKNFIFLSTLDIYEPTQVNINELSSLGPVSLYGNSKLYCEKMIELWGKSKNVRIKILRIGHVYGPGEEKYQKIIPASFARLLNGLPIQIWGSGNDLRSFIYIDDVVKLIMKSLQLSYAHQPINIVSNKAISLKALAELILKVSGVSLPIEYISFDGPRRDITFDNGMMQRILDSENTTLEEGLAIEWSYFKQKG